MSFTRLAPFLEKHSRYEGGGPIDPPPGDFKHLQTLPVIGLRGFFLLFLYSLFHFYRRLVHFLFHSYGRFVYFLFNSYGEGPEGHKLQYSTNIWHLWFLHCIFQALGDLFQIVVFVYLICGFFIVYSRHQVIYFKIVVSVHLICGFSIVYSRLQVIYFELIVFVHLICGFSIVYSRHQVIYFHISSLCSPRLWVLHCIFQALGDSFSNQQSLFTSFVGSPLYILGSR